MASTTILSHYRDNPSLECTTPSLFKYASKLVYRVYES